MYSVKSKLDQSLPMPDLRPEDSVSNISLIISKSTKLSKGSVNSRASNSSSFANAAKLRVSGRKAALSAEIASKKDGKFFKGKNFYSTLNSKLID